MIDVVILTMSKKGSASVQLAELVKSKKIKVRAVIFSQGIIGDKKKYYRKKLRKIFKIGLLGSLNGVRMRKWYSHGVSNYLKLESIESICDQNNIPLKVTTTINSPTTIEYLKKTNADVGLSLGNGYIKKEVFSIPKFGMINIHHEELPAYKNAQSIIWQIYNNSNRTGYTIHKIDTNIDSGEILFKEMIPITIKKDLKNTVSFNYARLWEKSSIGLIRVLENFEIYFDNRNKQERGASYTTPSFRQYLRIVRNFRKMKKESDCQDR